MGLYDRDYMRDDEPGFRRAPSRPWSATTWLLVVLGTLFAIQTVAHLYGSWWLETHFALSLDGIRSGKVWQLLTFQFLHGNIVHVAMNGLGLFSLGRFLEQQLGRNRFLLLYFLSGTAGGVLQVAATWLLGQNPYIPVVGASAGISGLLGAFVLTYPDQKLFIFPLPFPIKAWTLLWIVLPISVIGTVFPFWRIAHAAHLGGLLAGGAFIRWTWLSPRMASLIPSAPKAAGPPTMKAAPDDTDDFIASEVDPILEKIATHGIHSLTERERKILETARSRMNQK